jgi:ATP-dependent Clp protease ATP-binding subunit ClpA
VLKAAALEKYQLNSGQLDLEVSRHRIEQLKIGMNQEVLGQATAKKAMLSVWKRKLSGVGDPDHVASLLFVGAPGVGKTRLASLSADLMGYRKKVIEMNRFQKGDIDEFRREVYGALLQSTLHVFILDEIEKADLSVQEAALGMLQSGQFTVAEKLLGGGLVYREVSAKNAVFILTSNAGSEYIEKYAQSEDQTELRDILAKEGISAAILSRILGIIPMHRPNQAEFKQALQYYLRKTLEREGVKNHVRFELTNEAEFIAKAMSSYTSQLDYRDVRKLLLTIEEKIAEALLSRSSVGRNTESGVSEVIQLTWDESLEPLPKRHCNEAWRSMYL